MPLFLFDFRQRTVLRSVGPHGLEHRGLGLEHRLFGTLENFAEASLVCSGFFWVVFISRAQCLNGSSPRPRLSARHRGCGRARPNARYNNGYRNSRQALGVRSFEPLPRRAGVAQSGLDRGDSIPRAQILRPCRCCGQHANGGYLTDRRGDLLPSGQACPAAIPDGQYPPPHTALSTSSSVLKILKAPGQRGGRRARCPHGSPPPTPPVIANERRKIRQDMVCP